MFAAEEAGEAVVEIRDDTFAAASAPDALALAVLGDREHLALLGF